MNLESSPSDFPIHWVEQVATVAIPKRLSVTEAVNFKTISCQLLETEPLPVQLRLDFNLTEFIDSSGIGALVLVLKQAKLKKIALTLSQVNPNVMAVLSLTGLDTILTIEKFSSQNTADAIISLSPEKKEEVLPPKTHPSIRSLRKRSIDIVGSLVGLALTGIIFIPIAIAIKLDSPGPIFFSQTRCGWLGKRFKIFKFRSMVTDAEALKSQIRNEVEGAIFKNKNDPRVTKVGQFLRRTSLDELPQFWNVLKGEMSLVGTRPPTPEEVDRYEVPEWQRLDVKPGITGEWQVNGRSNIKKFEDIIKLDLRYQQNWSHAYDLQLILKTILIVFNKNSGAS